MARKPGTLPLSRLSGIGESDAVHDQGFGCLSLRLLRRSTRVHGGWDAGSAGHWDGYGILYVSCGRSSQQDGSIAERRSSDFVSQTSSKAAAEFSGTRVRFVAVKTRVLEAGCIRLFILVIVAPLLLLLLWFASLSLPFLSAPVSDS